MENHACQNHREIDEHLNNTKVSYQSAVYIFHVYRRSYHNLQVTTIKKLPMVPTIFTIIHSFVSYPK